MKKKNYTMVIAPAESILMNPANNEIADTRKKGKHPADKEQKLLIELAAAERYKAQVKMEYKAARKEYRRVCQHGGGEHGKRDAESIQFELSKLFPKKYPQ